MRFFASLILTVVLAALGSAQSPAKLLERAEKALGGKKALQSVKSVVKRGTITRTSDGSKGAYLLEAAASDLYHLKYDVAGFEYERGRNGRSGWERDSREGLRTLTGKPSIDIAAIAGRALSLWTRYKDEKSRLSAGGKQMIDGRETNVVVITNPKGAVAKYYFDAATSLPVREEYSFRERLERLDMSDLRKVGASQQPHAYRWTIDGEIYEIELESVRVGQPIASTAFNFPVISSEPLPDIQALLTELQANEDRVEGILDNYSYKQKVIKRELGKDGVLRETTSETFHLSFIKGQRVSRLIEKNGVPLGERQQSDADKDAVEQAEKLEKEAAKEAKRSASGAPSGEGRRISIADVLRASKLVNPRRERFRDRDMIVFDFEPNPSYDLSKAKSMLKFFGKTAGVMWIDEKDKQVARLEAALFESFKVGGGVLAKLQKGASFTLEQQRVGDEIWLPSQADINLSVRVLLVKGITVNQVIRSYDYSKFSTEVKDAKVDEKQSP